MNENATYIFTDGSSRGNPGPGGWGVVIVGEERVIELGGRETHTTNNRMELTAAVKALEQVHTHGLKIRVFTDSGYLVNGITQWIFGWQKRGWKTADKKAVLNRDLWEQLLALSVGKSIEWKQVSGHAGVAGNERCDEIATTFADGSTPSLYSGVLENYRIKNILDVPRR